jgi:hypothetical protein
MISQKIAWNFLLGLLITLSIHLFSQVKATAQTMEIIQVNGSQWGVTTRYIGATEGNSRFDLKDLQDLGINTYRIYGGMPRWETQDDDSRYGWPSITDIKANPNLINWSWWDNVMDNPLNGSDYWSANTPNTIWKGNARTIFSTLRAAKIRPVLTIRNVDQFNNPAWAKQLNPPRTEADWNEWWEHVFATVYWLNVRNDYGVDDFEIHNEPDHREQGWGGTQAEYFELIRVAKDAIAHVYQTYLPNRIYHIHAPMTVGGSQWPLDSLQKSSTRFDSVNIHNYDLDISSYTQRVHDWMNNTSYSQAPLWLGEWGTYQNEYESLPFSINLIKNMIRGSQPEKNYIYGSHLFSLYDWHYDWGSLQGLVGQQGEKRAGYYAFRMGIRALQGGRPTFFTASNNLDLMGITTQDVNGNLYLLLVNSGQELLSINADLSAFMSVGIGDVWEFSENVKDEIVGNLSLKNGHAIFQIPKAAAILININK